MEGTQVIQKEALRCDVCMGLCTYASVLRMACSTRLDSARLVNGLLRRRRASFGPNLSYPSRPSLQPLLTLRSTPRIYSSIFKRP
ncbi:hypothetical protein BC939DRAFT_445461 [Gamsiella multidivaricata]|uniref:uncharacterized protein n=1 Tax=Gamsiella multidivaricata TaxID=101098 RepID=UPI00221E8D52|nr:uncharacterized protein BC939DRAFT_445461 [Gamsiella multidivaricata]KAI7827513.1 hypothetical protein BC939DRAFT_445461 [Gamsiella multidivaricata]